MTVFYGGVQMEYVPGQFHTTALRSDLKYRAKGALSGKWGSVAITMLVFFLLSIACNVIPVAGSILLLPPLEMGIMIYFIHLYRYADDRMENLFKGFDMFGKSLAVFWLSALFIWLWSLLFVIPGIIAAYRYSQAMLILYDNPEISALEAINRSKAMMYGNKLTLFIQDLSFIGWFLLSVFPGFYIGYLWSMPYYYTTRIAFYENLLESAKG